MHDLARAKTHTSVMTVILLLPLVLGPALAGAGAEVDLSTPERTVKSYLDAWKRGDQPAAAGTFLRENEPMGYIQGGADLTYEIMEERLILKSKLMKQPGDVQVVTYLTEKWPQGPVEMITTFQLRRVNGQWKIVDFESIKPGAEAPD